MPVYSFAMEILRSHNPSSCHIRLQHHAGNCLSPLFYFLISHQKAILQESCSDTPDSKAGLTSAWSRNGRQLYFYIFFQQFSHVVRGTSITSKAIVLIITVAWMKRMMHSSARIPLLFQIPVNIIAPWWKTAISKCPYKLIIALIVTNRDHTVQKTFHCSIQVDPASYCRGINCFHNKKLDHTGWIHTGFINRQNIPCFQIFHIHRPVAAVPIYGGLEFLLQFSQTYLFFGTFPASSFTYTFSETIWLVAIVPLAVR